MRTPRLITLPALVALALACGSALAQVPGPGSSATGGQAAPAAQPGTGTRNTPSVKLSHGDRKFIEHAALSGEFEVQAAQLASTKATDANVKSFAGMLVDQHTAANNELTKIANAKGVELPIGSHRQGRKIEHLANKSGEDFDRSFVRDVGIKAHEKDIRMFEKAGKHVKDADLKAFVDKTLPTLREHLAAAEKLPRSGKNAAAPGTNRR